VNIAAVSSMTDSASVPANAPRPVTPSRPRLAFIGATSLTFLKPRIRTALRPVAASLARAGVTANQVTLLSLAGSVLIGAFLCVADNPRLFAVLPVWLVVRMACATIDGTLAIEFGQKSRLGGILNEAGDIISDIALFLPLMFVAPFAKSDIGFLILLTVACELAGIAGPMLGSNRRLEGPLGKADRAIVLLVLAIAIAACDPLPRGAWLIVPVLALGLAVTLWNRIRFARADPKGGLT
jgi:CDP-diacylglycerol---glycerol-3-phosphate 3-phosphatidyltransferase